MIYFDNSATTKPSQSVINEVNKTMTDVFGNPSSGHFVGMSAASHLKSAREAVSASLKVSPDEFYFTGSGTLADNIAIFGGAKKGVGRHVVTTAVEHHAVLHSFQELEKRGFDVTYINPAPDGNISIEDIKNALREDTSFVSIMRTNNETGAIFPVEGVKSLMNKICPRAYLHTDAVQAYGKEEINPQKWGVDLLSVSAHKIHGPLGIGGLYIKKGVTLNGFIFGGGQERGIHSGTENLPAAAGFAAAAREISYDDSGVKEINSYLRAELEASGLAEINSPSDASPYILNVSFTPVPSEVVLNALSAEGICASAGSACAANRSGESHVLKAMGKSPKSAVRFSFSKDNTLDEAKKLIKVLNDTIPLLKAVVKNSRRLK